MALTLNTTKINELIAIAQDLPLVKPDPTGNIEIMAQSGNNVFDYATASVRSGAIAINTPSINTSTGLITASANLTTTGWVNSTPASKTLQLTTQPAKTITPTTSAQTAVAANVYTTGAINVAAIPLGSIAVNTPSINTSTGLITASTSLSTSGWIETTPSSKTLQLTTQAAKTITPTTSAQTAVAANVYTTGAINVAAIQTETKTVDLSLENGNQVVNNTSGKYITSITINKPEGLIPNNIKGGVVIAGVTGTYVSGGGGDITVNPLTVTENGVYTPATNNYYSTVTVAIPYYDGSVS